MWRTTKCKIWMRFSSSFHTDLAWDGMTRPKVSEVCRGNPSCHWLIKSSYSRGLYIQTSWLAVPYNNKLKCQTFFLTLSLHSCSQPNIDYPTLIDLLFLLRQKNKLEDREDGVSLTPVETGVRGRCFSGAHGQWCVIDRVPPYLHLFLAFTLLNLFLFCSCLSTFPTGWHRFKLFSLHIVFVLFQKSHPSEHCLLIA